MKKIDIKEPGKQLTRMVEKEFGLYDYRDTLDLTKVGTKKYQKNYKRYYRVRREENWCAAYFDYMQKQVGNSDITFEEILTQISNIRHNTKYGSKSTNDAVYASKMLATLNSNYPILDSHVKKIIGIKSQFRTLEEAIESYTKLTEIVHNFLQTTDGAECIEEFDRFFPNFVDINPVKKIDLYLWKMGK